MNYDIQDLIDGLKVVNEPLKSLGKVEPNTYYYRDATDGCFYMSGGGWVEGTIGKGLISSLWVSTSRTLSAETDYLKLAKGIRELRDDVLLVTQKIQLVLASSDISIDQKASFKPDLMKLCRRVRDAARGVKIIEEHYAGERDKKKTFEQVYQLFFQAWEQVGAEYAKLERLISERAIKEEEYLRQKAGMHQISPNLSERSVSDLTPFEKRRIKSSAKPMALLPKELTKQAMINIYEFLEENRAALKKEIKEHAVSFCRGVIKRKEKTKLARTLTVFTDRVYVHLKAQTDIPKVKRMFEYNNYTDALYTKIPHWTEKKEQASDRQLEIYRSMKGLRGIGELETSVTYRSKDRSHFVRTFILKFYNEGSLETCIRERRLNLSEKHHVMLDILHGLNEIHEKGYLHLNISPTTILVDKGSEISGALIGFDQACLAKESDTYDESTDLWLLGHTMYALFFDEETEVTQFLREHPITALTGIEGIRRNREYEEPEQGTIEHLIWGLMRPHGRDRPTLKNAIETVDFLIQFQKSIADLDKTCQDLETKKGSLV